MAESNNSSALHWILGAALLLITLFVVVALVGANSQADELNSSAGVANAAPTVDSIYFDSVDTYQTDGNGTNEVDGIFELTSGSNTTLNISGVVTDTNGDSDITLVDMLFYSPEVGTFTDCFNGPDPNHCYKLTSCTTQANDADSLTYNCAVDVVFWANSTTAGGAEAGQDWTARVNVNDSSQASGNMTATIDIATMLSLDMPGPIDWGTLAQNVQTVSGTNEDQTITQKGNDKADINLSGTDMGCTNTGTIPVGNIKYDLNDDGHASGGAALSGTPTLLDVTIPYQITAGAVTDSVHWEIQIPQYDVSGTCTGTITMTAVASAD